MLARIIAQADQQGALHHEPGRRRLRRQGGHDLPGHAGADGDEDAAARCGWCSRARNRSSPPPSAIPSRTTYKMGLTRDGRIRAVEMQDDLRRRRLRPVDRRRDAQGRDPGRRALRHPERARSTPTASTPTTRRRAPSARSARCRRSSRPNPISTSAPRSSASIRSRSAASTPCATAPRPTPSRS